MEWFGTSFVTMIAIVIVLLSADVSLGVDEDASGCGECLERIKLLEDFLLGDSKVQSQIKAKVKEVCSNNKSPEKCMETLGTGLNKFTKNIFGSQGTRTTICSTIGECKPKKEDDKKIWGCGDCKRMLSGAGALIESSEGVSFAKSFFAMSANRDGYCMAEEKAEDEAFCQEMEVNMEAMMDKSVPYVGKAVAENGEEICRKSFGVCN